MLGNLVQTAEETGIPVDTLKSWKKQSWWPRMMAQVKGEANASLAARYRKIVERTQQKLLERVENGDITLGKDGEQVVLPVRAKDLAVIAGIATQQMDKLEGEIKHEDTLSVTERLTKIAEELVKMHVNKRVPETFDAEYVDASHS